MKSIIFHLIIVIELCVCNAFGQVDLPMQQEQPINETTKSGLLSAFGKVPLHFVANQGQFAEEVVYYAKSEGATVYCTEQGLVFGFAEGSISLKFNVIASCEQRSKLKQSLRVKPEARGELQGKVNYFIGNDSVLWRTDIPTFKEVVYREVYPGINLVYSGSQRRLKYTFYLQPNSDPNQILMIYDGIESLCVDDATGELVIQTEWGEMRDAKPVAYQEIEGVRKEVDISFRLMGGKRVGFAVGDYDPNFMLTLDPGYSTYLGGSDSDEGLSIAVDNLGNAYVTGLTVSSKFPTQNPFQGSHGGGNCDIFVTKLSSSSNMLIYSTYIGGSDPDSGNDIAVDSSGNAYVTGQTLSSDFPTQNPFQSSKAGYNDAFVAKLENNGSALSYSTYLGGSGEDLGHGIAVDSLWNAYVTGFTGSSDFPLQNPFQSGYAQGDVFVTKFSSSGNTLIYSTYLGGESGADSGNDIAVDSSGNAYVTGYTGSSDFPIQNPFQGSKAGVWDAFVTKLANNGSALNYSTYLGGSGNDYGCGIAVDGSGDAYVTGYTWSSDFPTQNPFQGSKAGGDWDAFVTKLSSNGNTLRYSTYLGGSSRDTGCGIAVDGWGNAYVTGQTGSSDFPIQNPFQSSYAGADDAFVTKLSNANTLIYSTYLGGSGDDFSHGIAVDSFENAYVTGGTYSSDFPTQKSFQGSNAGVSDAFVASFLPDGTLSEAPYSGPIWYVSTEGSDKNDGNKDKPFATIQRGIDAAQHGDTVLVADGTWTGEGNKNLDFKGKVIIVTSENGARNCIIDCENDGRGFYFHSGETETSVVDGFTIKNGYTGNTYPDNRGGGIRCGNASPTIINNIIKNNSAPGYKGYGGGISCFESSPMISNNTIINNSAGYNAGGIVCWDNSSPTIENNTIMDNSADYGGGISCYLNSSPLVINNVIAGNSVSWFGGAIHCERDSNLIIKNNTITGNYAQESGGAIQCKNRAAPVIVNTILWGNSPQEIYFRQPDAPSTDPCTVTISYSDIQGGQAGIVTNDNGTVNWLEGNIDADPLFVDPENGDYHLQAGAPCIDTGDPNSSKDPDGTRADIGAFYYDQSVNPVPTMLEKVSGDNQSGNLGAVLPNPLVVHVFDQYNEPMEGLVVNFEPGEGASVNPTQAMTNEDGLAQTMLTLGTQPGEYNVTASIESLTPVVFAATAIVVDTFVVDAGEDKTICHPQKGGSIQIGGAPTASGGTPPYRYSWTPTTGLDDATVANPIAIPTETTTYIITVTDSSEPPQEASDSVTVNVDDTPPNPPEIQISSTSGDTVTMSKATITVKGSGESGASIQSATLHELQNNSIRDSTDVKDYVSIDNGNISGSFDVGELADVDEIQLVIILSDIFNYSEPGRSNKLKVDKENPIVALEQPGNGSYFNTAPIIISGTAKDDTGVIKVEVDTGEGFAVAGGTNEWRYSFEPENYGKYTVTVRAFDGVNRISENAECTFSYFSYLPTAAITYPLDGAELIGAVDIFGSAGDVNDDLRDFSYTLEYAEGVNPSEGFIKITTVEGKPVQDGKLGEWDISGLVKGVYTLRLTVKTSEATVDVTRNNLMVKGHKMVTLKLNLDRGWNLISFPGDVIEPSSPTGFFGTEITQILNANYKTPDVFEIGEGYWALAIKDTGKEVKLIPKEIYTRNIKRGWNVIGSVYGEACIPEGVIQLNRFNAKTKQNESASRIEWGIGYWALAIEDAQIMVDGTKPCIPAPQLHRSNNLPLWTFPIQVMAENSITKTHLTIGIHPDAKSGWDSRFDVALPPPSPGGELPRAALLLDGDFPLRLSKKILPVPKTGESQFLLQVTNPEGDAVLSWDVTKIPDDWSLMLTAQKDMIDMAAKSTYSIPKGEREIVLVLNCLPLKQPLPKFDALFQNFPNPFNPETWIPYQLAKDSNVTLTIYDVSGRMVHQLFLGKKAAGDYQTQENAAHWDGYNQYGESVASGVYFYRLQTEDYTATRKMCILK